MRILAYITLPLIVSCSPASYEDCVLNEIKDAKNKASTYAVRLACRAKFPEKLESTASYDPHYEAIWDKEFTHLTKVELTDIVTQYKVKLTNRNDDVITNVTLGSSREPACGSDKNSYNELILCEGEIQKNSTNTMDCKTNIPQNESLCLVAVTYEQWSISFNSSGNKEHLTIMQKIKSLFP